jgi:hypothetical protein
MLERHAAKGPKRILQPLGQSDEALTADHDLGMPPAAERQAKVVESVREGLAGDDDPEFGGVGEVRQALLTWRMLLAEDDLLLRPVQRLPVADPALEGAADALSELGMATPQFAQDGYRAQGRVQLAASGRSRYPRPRRADQAAGGFGVGVSARAAGDPYRAGRPCWR